MVRPLHFYIFTAGGEEHSSEYLLRSLFKNTPPVVQQGFFCAGILSKRGKSEGSVRPPSEAAEHQVCVRSRAFVLGNAFCFLSARVFFYSNLEHFVGGWGYLKMYQTC